MKKRSAKHSKLLLSFAALFMRWAMMFIVIFSLITLIDLISSGNGRGGSVVFRIVFAAVGSVIVNFIAYFFIIPKLNKQYGVFRKILMRIAESGYSGDIIAQMEEQLRVCQSEPQKYTPYINQYAMFLAEAYLSLQEYNKAEEKLKIADMDFMEQQAKNPNSLPAQHNIVMLCVLWVQFYSALGEKSKVEDQLRFSEKYFSKYRGMNEITDYFIDTAYFESLMIHGQYDNAIKLLDKYASDEQLIFGVCLDKARCLMKMDRKDEAEALFDKAHDLATNDWRRKTVELERIKNI